MTGFTDRLKQRVESAKATGVENAKQSQQKREQEEKDRKNLLDAAKKIRDKIALPLWKQAATQLNAAQSVGTDGSQGSFACQFRLITMTHGSAAFVCTCVPAGDQIRVVVMINTQDMIAPKPPHHQDSIAVTPGDDATAQHWLEEQLLACVGKWTEATSA